MVELALVKPPSLTMGTVRAGNSGPGTESMSLERELPKPEHQTMALTV